MYSIFIWLFPHRLVDRPVPIETDREAKLFPSPETGTGQMALRERRIWDGFCPEGTAGFSPGFQPDFNPGERPRKRSALKGRELARINPTHIAPQNKFLGDRPGCKNGIRFLSAEGATGLNAWGGAEPRENVSAYRRNGVTA